MNLGLAIAAFRHEHRYGVREMASIIGISHATLSRIELGEDCSGIVLSKILTWLLASRTGGAPTSAPMAIF